ncbi:uncharacterized protein LOC125691998 [Lagopus muta]|uniref:uncharacterized protein LOC125691998 n=1 Tax=Lagopus muta TaxID=64668 RepID=UPI00209DC775|nr:uncharacterized protein LOC125691998 [Lagopus muta]
MRQIKMNCRSALPAVPTRAAGRLGGGSGESLQRAERTRERGGLAAAGPRPPGGRPPERDPPPARYRDPPALRQAASSLFVFSSIIVYFFLFLHLSPHPPDTLSGRGEVVAPPVPGRAARLAQRCSRRFSCAVSTLRTGLPYLPVSTPPKLKNLFTPLRDPSAFLEGRNFLGKTADIRARPSFLEDTAAGQGRSPLPPAPHSAQRALKMCWCWRPHFMSSALARPRQRLRAAPRLQGEMRVRQLDSCCQGAFARLLPWGPGHLLPAARWRLRFGVGSV